MNIKKLFIGFSSLLEILLKIQQLLSLANDKVVNKIYTDMRQREEDKDADVKELHLKINGVTKDLSEKVELTERRIMEKIEELKKDIADHNQKEDSELRKIWEFKWMAAGGIIAVAWLLSHVKLEALSKLF